MCNRPLDEESESYRDVYAYYGLAMYYAQVLEHGIVNALAIFTLTPSENIHNKETWEKIVNDFYKNEFEKTMGKIIKEIVANESVNESVIGALNNSLKVRNHLAHDFFKEHAASFANKKGRQSMIDKLNEYKDLFISTDLEFSAITQEKRNLYGISDLMIEQEISRMKNN